MAEAARCQRYACHACGAVYVRTHRPSVCQRCHSPVILAAPLAMIETTGIVERIAVPRELLCDTDIDLEYDIRADLGLNS